MNNYYNYKITTNDKINAQRKTIYVDKYAKFFWRGLDSYENFGCFITNKGDLKWVNSASFSDITTNTMFEDGMVLLGTNFVSKQISLTLNVYYITYNLYREFINWLNPTIIGTLSFGYAPEWEYYVKISSLSDGTFNKIGVIYNEDCKKFEDVFNVSLTIKFTTVGQNCVTCKNCWEVISSPDAQNKWKFYFTYDQQKNNELNTSIIIQDSFRILHGDKYSVNIYLLDEQGNPIANSKKHLFSFVAAADYDLSLFYNSKEGRLYINDTLIFNLLTCSNGDELFSNFEINQFILPGVLNNLNLDKNVIYDGKRVFPFAIELIYESNSGQYNIDNLNISIYPTRQL